MQDGLEGYSGIFIKNLGNSFFLQHLSLQRDNEKQGSFGRLQFNADCSASFKPRTKLREGTITGKGEKQICRARAGSNIKLPDDKGKQYRSALFQQHTDYDHDILASGMHDPTIASVLPTRSSANENMSSGPSGVCKHAHVLMWIWRTDGRLGQLATAASASRTKRR